MTQKILDSIFLDSNIFIQLMKSPEYKKRIGVLFQSSYLHVVNKVVLMELWAGVRNSVEEALLSEYQKNYPLMEFSGDHFIAAGQILKKMNDDHQLEPRTRRRLTWDILIALSAKENNSLLLTENETDFKKIQKYVDFEFMTPN